MTGFGIYRHLGLFLILYLVVSPDLLPVAAQFAAPILLEQVTTFHTCADTGGDDEAADAQCATMEDDDQLTAVRVLVAPERTGDDQANFLTFFAFPQTTETSRINDKDGDEIDPLRPCADLPEGSNCVVYAGPANGTQPPPASPLVMTFQTSSFVRSYQLQRKDLRVPYAYLDYDADILGCDPDANQFLCTQIVSISLEFIAVIQGICIGGLWMACSLGWVMITLQAYCIAGGITNGIRDAAVNNSFVPYFAGFNTALLAIGVSPSNVAAVDAIYTDLWDQYNASEYINGQQFVNPNSNVSAACDNILLDLCVIGDPICDSLPDDLPPTNLDVLICNTCTLRRSRQKSNSVTRTVCTTFYGLPDDYCAVWDPWSDITTCSVSDARLFFGDWNQLMNPAVWATDGGGQGVSGDEATTRNAKSQDSSYKCRGPQNDFLSALTPNSDAIIPSTDRNYNPGPCYACSIPIFGTNEGNDRIPDHPDTVPQICPAMEPKLPFCYLRDTSNPRDQIGLGSTAQITTPNPEWCAAEQDGRDFPKGGCRPMTGEPDNPNFYSLWTEAADAYMCSIAPSSEYYSEANFKQCQLLKNLDGQVANKEEVAKTIALEAIRTVATCPIDEGGTFEIAYGEWKKPGDRNLAVRPGQPTNSFYVARCSAGCQTNPTFVQRFKYEDGLPTSSSAFTDLSQAILIPDIVISQIKQRASLWMGGPQCSVYEIQPTPYGEMEVQVTLTYPDGSRERVNVQTDNGPSYQVSGGDVPFTVNINHLTIPAAATGPLISGLIVVCGTTDVDFDNIKGCDLSNGFDGQIRGRLPEDDNLTRQFTNPWSEVVANALRLRNEKGDLRPDEATLCPMPIPYYLADLNCGVPAYWYHVPLVDTPTYGNGCGQNGFDQRETSNPSIASLLCQQGEGASCTPGFDLPAFGGVTNGRQARSACQELGFMVNVTGNSRTTPCTTSSPRPRNMPPGFSWAQDNSDTYDQGPGSELNRVVPNMWVDGTKLYIMNKFFQGLVRADVSVYIDADLDSETITIVPGEMLVNETYCGAALNVQNDGKLGVTVRNKSLFSAGTYIVRARCQSTQSEFTITVDPPDFPIQTLPPGETIDVEFQIGPTAGALVLGTTVCTLTLEAGGGVVQDERLPDGGFLQQIIVNCDIFLPDLISYAYQDFTAGAGETKQCDSWDFFCMLSKQPWYIRYIVYVVLGIIVIGLTVIAITSFTYAATRTSELEAKRKLWISMEKQLELRQKKRQ